jgi:hypothetical protein
VACVVVGAAWTVEEARGAVLVPGALGSVASEAIVVSEVSRLTDDFGAALVEVPAEVAAEPMVEAVVAATLTCADGLCAVTGTDIADAWAGWLEAVVPSVIAAAAAAMPTTPTELSSTPFVGCSGLSVGRRPGVPLGAWGFGRACRAPVLLSRIGFPSRGDDRKGPP